jgi:CheY-like chemotaxis protein
MFGKRVLVVDDDPVLRSSLQAYLEDHGYAVETAENGREALTKLDHAVYDTVLLDYNMPQVNGLAVLRHIRQHCPSLPVVMMTGERGSHVAVQSLVALGAQACLFKPFDPQNLEQILTSASATAVRS